MTRARAVTAAVILLFAIVFAAYTLTPLLGLQLGVGYPLITALAIGWRWTLPATVPRRWWLTGIVLGLLGLLAFGGYQAAALNGADHLGRVFVAGLVVIFFLPALSVATADRVPGSTRENTERASEQR